MGFFNRFQRKSNAASIEAMLSQPYEQTYFDECKYVWKNYVPKTGQSACLQGELLREIESIRCEAQDNGNVNWDDDFSRFCDFISGTLSEQPIFSDKEKEEITSIMAYLKERGLYAQDVYSGKAEESGADMSRVAYLDDNIYDVICDKIGRLQREHPEPIPYEKDIGAKR